MTSTNEIGLASERVESSTDIDLSDVHCSTICENILWKPVSCQQCETHFCSKCITKWLTKNPNQCPLRCDSFVFTEIDPRVFADSTIKHARLANWSEYICYAGEFHLRPKFGWTKLNDEWELVFDNASGTYSPNAELLINLKKLLLFNFPGLNITTYDYKDPMLRDSIEQLEIIARRYKNNNI
ncbi:unnamed protein product [Adineta steineri]|uniref:RING-type domain-containing protein n=1 Tax=Adineta steineri TaxID=433720 RepID=A0A813SGV6_9BILA|nr:unnamed protein product [Adineta steineri]